jgi:hypothetical protein
MACLCRTRTLSVRRTSFLILSRRPCASSRRRPGKPFWQLEAARDGSRSGQCAGLPGWLLLRRLEASCVSTVVLVPKQLLAVTEGERGERGGTVQIRCMCQPRASSSASSSLRSIFVGLPLNYCWEDLTADARGLGQDEGGSGWGRDGGFAAKAQRHTRTGFCERLRGGVGEEAAVGWSEARDGSEEREGRSWGWEDGRTWEWLGA